MSDELTAPRDPGSYARRPSRRGAWVVVAFGLACLAAGYGLARFGPQLYPDKPAPGVVERPQPLAAAKAASAARAPGDGAGVLERVGYALSRVVALRRVGEVPGDSADARLARAEQQMQDGDVAAALKTLEALPAAAKDALGPWRDRAERRAKLDRDIAAVRAQAMEELGRLSQAGA